MTETAGEQAQIKDQTMTKADLVGEVERVTEAVTAAVEPLRKDLARTTAKLTKTAKLKGK